MRDRFPFFEGRAVQPNCFKLLSREDRSAKTLRNVGSYNSNDKALAYIL
jgi:hypothetical protein